MAREIRYPFQQGPAEFSRLLRQGQFFAEDTRRFLDRSEIASASRVLDFGCGTGAVSDVVTSICDRAAQILAYDSSPEAVALARNGPNRDRVQFVNELPSGPFDAIVGRMVLMYVEAPVLLLEQLRLLLKPGGILALQESDHEHYMATRPASPLFEEWRKLIMATGSRCGVRLDTARRLPELLEAAGFEVIDFDGAESRVEHGAPSPLHDMFAETALGMEGSMRDFHLRNEAVPRDLGQQFRSEARDRGLLVRGSSLFGVIGRRL